MDNITYLFGAGASCGDSYKLNEGKLNLEGIPIVSNFNKDVYNFLSIMESNKPNGIYTQKLLDTYYQIDSHFSFDTYAKKLFLKNNIEELENLKILLNNYLLYKINFMVKRDLRYDLFFATLLNHNLDPSINFISYNYDTYIENSIASFAKNEDYKELLYYGYGRSLNSDKSTLTKLNGSAL